jgi:hypothetical protein
MMVCFVHVFLFIQKVRSLLLGIHSLIIMRYYYHCHIMQ